jgi:hypothetical protein
MLATDIIDRVARIIQDDSYTSTDILDLINEGRLFIAGEVEPGLPGLRASDTVTTTDEASAVDLPDDYHKGLFWVGSTAQACRIGTKASDYHNLLTFLNKYTDLTTVGLIEAVCVDGAELLYQGMADDTLTLKYFRKPVDIALADIADAEDGLPAELPTHLQRKLLVSYCCKEIYVELEDGIEGRTPNVDRYTKMFDEAMAELRVFAHKSHPRETKHMRDVE